MSAMIQAVIFDIDGTLLDTERIYVRAWQAAAREMGYEMPDDLMRRTRAISAKIGPLTPCFLIQSKSS